MSERSLIQTTFLQTEDFDELQETSTAWDQEYFQLSPGQFEGSVELTEVGSRQIFRERWGRKIRYRGIPPPGSFGFALPLDQLGMANWIGRSVCSDTVIMQAPGKEADYISSAYWDALVLVVSEGEVHSTVSVLSGGSGVIGKLHGDVTFRQKVADRLRRLGLNFLRRSKMSSEDETQVLRLNEQFVKLFLWELVDSLEGSNTDVRPSKTSDIVRQATDLFLSNQTNAIGLMEICSHQEISLRALHYAFQDVAGMSPATWLRRIRLNQIRKTLQRSSPDDVLIKQVALDNGFFHFGHLSRSYKALFGELPSDTLSKTPTSLGYRRSSAAEVSGR